MGYSPHGTQSHGTMDGPWYLWMGHGIPGWAAVPMDGTWHPFPGDQPLSSLRQTAFPAHHSARSTTAPTGGHADASTPFASPTSLVSPTASAKPGLQGWGAGSSFNYCPGRHSEAEGAAGASIPTDQPVCPHPGGTHAAFPPSP